MRFGREAVPVMTDENTPFTVGKARVVREGADVTVFANGAMVYEACEAAKALAQEGIEATVIDLHTVKPMDEVAVIDAARKTGCIVTAEEHQVYGGMGSAVAECVAKNYPVPIEMVAVEDSFGESGRPEELMAKYGLSKENIYLKVKKVLTRK